VGENDIPPTIFYTVPTWVFVILLWRITLNKTTSRTNWIIITHPVLCEISAKSSRVRNEYENVIYKREKAYIPGEVVKIIMQPKNPNRTKCPPTRSWSSCSKDKTTSRFHLSSFLPNHWIHLIPVMFMKLSVSFRL